MGPCTSGEALMTTACTRATYITFCDILLLYEIQLYVYSSFRGIMADVRIHV